ncbi:IPExxxVDY family protein [Aestuariibaculum sediminum]|uniref:IPExxxVDY family protein n=1 Tax=Aestuariibaculum sediminum TaxID=2770637 RepID=A0A8J6U6X4_9FLAO|nr:IPExxxVDY family protein [Aestuariibaculum sediminum]MBD0831133.1 IPExxxVDY family protein [Aestuariibaculum sediminum]
MAIHKLVLDDVFDEVSYTLIAIHCSIDDYRLAYLLNKHLGINLHRKSIDVDVSLDQSNYSVFEWKDRKQLTTWNLVANACKTEVYQKNTGKSLFDLQEKITRISYLVPEHKAVNYFLKIDNEFSSNKEKYILQSILNIPKVATAFSVDINNLKSKENLIF